MLGKVGQKLAGQVAGVSRGLATGRYGQTLPESVLVANRGEIANRVFRTAEELGVRTVAVYTDRDLSSSHIRNANERYRIAGDKGYLDIDEILSACKKHNVAAIHPGYGFLSENPEFAAKVAAAGVKFLGPNGETMTQFGLKDRARQMAIDAGVPVVPGSDILKTYAEAAAEADKVGYPVMLKAVAGGGGIGMSRVMEAGDMEAAFAKTSREATAAFGNGDLFLEKLVQRSRHIEVQIFGDGKGKCVHLGERECSMQRRNQKIIEEAPSPFVTDELRGKLTASAVALTEHVNYNSAGTVEFLVDGVTGEHYFLELNARLQVEHPITEESAAGDIDLVAWMLGDHPPLAEFEYKRTGHSIEARICCEDSANNFMPSAGTFTEVAWPPADMARVDTWIHTGTAVTPYFDNLVAKLIVTGPDRATALARFDKALAATKLAGPKNNLKFVRSLAQSEAFVSGVYDTNSLTGFDAPSPMGFEVTDPGIETTVQDWPGRTAATVTGGDAWRVGIPPSGPMDFMSFRVANRLVGNPEGTAALEMLRTGPTFKFNQDTHIAVCGGTFGKATLNGQPFAQWESVAVKTGDVLKMGKCNGGGVRGYLAVAGGIDVPDYLGSKSTLLLGGFGGFQGRKLLKGDILPIGEPAAAMPAAGTKPGTELVPAMGTEWEISVLLGPQATEYQTDADLEMFFGTAWKVHHNSNRLGVRFIGPRPEWKRTDGGQGGSHPSNIVDNEYAPMTINFTGDMPIAITVDGPSLGGFICNATMTTSDMWKIGQVKAGDAVTFKRIDMAAALAAQERLDRLIASVGRDGPDATFRPPRPLQTPVSDNDVVLATPEAGEPGSLNHVPSMKVRVQGDRFVLVEYGEQEIDFLARFRLFAVETYINEKKAAGGVAAGVREMSPGIVSLQIDYDNRVISLPELLALIEEAHSQPLDMGEMKIPSRIVRLPIALNDHWNKEALERYQTTVRPEAPYLPNNYDFVARNNGLGTDLGALRDIILNASYMCLGLGDVYLGCPCACPVDPRHRLINPKFNPARTFTPQGAVGIGGAFMCIYPLASPGGYQLVGRSLPIWNAYTVNKNFEAGKPWLLRHFDQVRFYQVSEEELEGMFDEYNNGLQAVKIEETTFSVKEYYDFINDPKVAKEAAEFQAKQAAATALELQAENDYWAKREAEGENEEVGSEADAADAEMAALEADDSLELVRADMTSSVLRVLVKEGDVVAEGQELAVFEAMKMEITLTSDSSGTIKRLFLTPGDQITEGQMLAAIVPAE